MFALKVFIGRTMTRRKSCGVQAFPGNALGMGRMGILSVLKDMKGNTHASWSLSVEFQICANARLDVIALFPPLLRFSSFRPFCMLCKLSDDTRYVRSGEKCLLCDSKQESTMMLAFAACVLLLCGIAAYIFYRSATESSEEVNKSRWG